MPVLTDDSATAQANR